MYLFCARVVCKPAWFEVLSNKCKNKGKCSRGKQTAYVIRINFHYTTCSSGPRGGARGLRPPFLILGKKRRNDRRKKSRQGK